MNICQEIIPELSSLDLGDDSIWGLTTQEDDYLLTDSAYDIDRVLQELGDPINWGI